MAESKVRPAILTLFDLCGTWACTRISVLQRRYGTDVIFFYYDKAPGIMGDPLTLRTDAVKGEGLRYLESITYPGIDLSPVEIIKEYGA